MKRLGGLAAAVALCALGVAGCDNSGPPIPLSRAQPNSTHAALAGNGSAVVSAPRGSVRTADFEMSSGVTTLVLHSSDLGGTLYRISTPAGAGVVPSAVVDDGEVVAQLASSGTNGPSLVDIDLSDAVAWTVHLDSGCTLARVDMRSGGLSVLNFDAGVTRIDATLPNAAVAVRMSGGASEFDVHAPSGVPVRVTMGGGGGNATIDGTHHSGIQGGAVFTPSTWPSTGSRIDIDNTAGVSTFTLDRY
ncbi:MAG TPA: hypothetical protein VGJ28_08880 [Micromonosporaceae bacterium]|jgi:hypothetical protein